MAKPENFEGLLEWRCVGPFRGGRVVAVAGDCHDPNIFYFGACAGGIWKTYDAGTYWENISDGFLNTAAIGALAVSESDPNVLYAGTGETTIRTDVSHGDGVYRSTDGGQTWQHIGLDDTRFIGKIRIHPRNPDVVYVAALGHAFGPNDERGVYKSTDGGSTWRRVLFKSARAGAVDLTIDPANPRVLYAAIWETYRHFWQISSGGLDSGLWRSTDGGETWEDIGDRRGLPKGIKGKIGVVASPARSGRVWALIEGEAGGLFRSDDGGETWELTSDNPDLRSRAWYYMHLTADPRDEDTLYVNNLRFWKSTDGGRNFSEIATPHGDNHDLWIDPHNPRRMIQGNDGGACVSLNGGATWSSIYNQPTAQFYHLATDTQAPYRVYGTQQDNSSISVPSRSRSNSILWTDCTLPGTGESGYIAVRPDDPNIVYVGAIGSSPGGGNALQRYDHRTQQIRLITTWPVSMSGRGAGEYKYRFAWTYPIVISPHDPNVLYVAGNLIFRTTNEGQSWEPISPDLTRADPDKLLPSGGPINRDAVGAEVYATVFAFAESPHEPGVFWAGSDDGLMHISRDGGRNWTVITPPELPEWTLISMIEPSPHDPATAYVAATRYKLDDYQPYLYKTNDYGQTWQTITNGIPEHDFTRVIREDPTRRGLLYVGTETGLYISFDDGAAWQRFQLNLPVAPIYDLQVKETDLVVATHGRSFWILDDLTPLHQLTDAVTQAEAHLFKPRTTIRVQPQLFEEELAASVPGKQYAGTLGVVAAYTQRTTPEETTIRTFLDTGQNPPRGVVVTYHLREPAAEKISLSFADMDGHVIREFFSRDPAEDAREDGTESSVAPVVTPLEGAERMVPPTPVATGEDKPKEPAVPRKAGWNRFIWNMRYPNVGQLEGDDAPAKSRIAGPMVSPGTYQVTLSVGEQTYTQSFDIVTEPGVTATQEDLQAQFDLLMQLYQKTSETITALNRMRDLRAQLDGWSKRVADLPDGKGIATAATALKEQVLEIEKTILIPDVKPGWAGAINHGARLLEQLTQLAPVVSLGDYRPTDQAYAVFAYLSGAIDQQITRLDELIATDLAALNTRIAAAQIPAVVPKGRPSDQR